MSIEIDFSYAIDGLYHSVNYYRSLTPMDPTAMPTPIATGITGTTYTDTTATLGFVYFVRFGSIRGEVEKISNEVRVEAGDPYWTNVVLYARLNSDAVDLSNYANTPTVGAFVSYADAKFGKGISCNGTYDTSVSYPATNFGVAENQDFVIDSWITCSAKPTGYWQAAFGNWSSDTGICLFVKPSRGFHLSINSAYVGNDEPYNINDLMNIVIERYSNVVTIYKNGVSMGTLSYSGAIQAKQFFLGGNGVGTDWWRGLVDEVRVTIGSARYKGNFSPQTREFYNF